MTKEIHFPPKHATGEFHCPHCGVYAKQKWSHLNSCGDSYSVFCYPVYKSSICGLNTENQVLPENWTISFCEHCKNFAIWLNINMIYPKKIIVAQPNDDLSDEIKKDYLEAANIFNDSPRSSAALLRQSIQKLCKDLGEKGENINDDIGSLVKKGLNPLVQKSFDALRITGNSGAHPGEINLEENPEKVIKLFELLNFIAEKMISEPKEIGNFYEDLPEGAKEAVVKRDSKEQ